MFYVYILRSLKNGRFYVGSTENVAVRLRQHNSGYSKSTKSYKPWKLTYTEEYRSRAAALFREKQIKSYKGGRAFKALVQSAGSGEVA